MAAVIRPIAISSQIPARVSAILRSSTPIRRPNGTGLVPETSRVGSGGRRGAHAGPPGDVVALGVGGEFEEQLLEAAMGGSKVDEHDALLGGDAADLDRLGLDGEPLTGGRPAHVVGVSACCSRELSSAITWVLVPRSASSAFLSPWATIRAAADQDHLVGDQLDLVEEVAGEEDGPAALGVGLEQAAHPADAGGVEPVGRLVEDQHRGVAEQGVGDAEALPHAERVVADPALRLGRGQRDQLEHLPHPRVRQPHRPGADRQDLAPGAAVVLGGGVEEDADVAARVGDVAEVVTRRW